MRKDKFTRELHKWFKNSEVVYYSKDKLVKLKERSSWDVYQLNFIIPHSSIEEIMKFCKLNNSVFAISNGKARLTIFDIKGMDVIAVTDEEVTE